jgi:hypothetical protein
MLVAKVELNPTIEVGLASALISTTNVIVLAFAVVAIIVYFPAATGFASPTPSTKSLIQLYLLSSLVQNLQQFQEVQ